MLLATTRTLGDRICPRCTIPTEEFDKLGLLRDITGRVTRARSYVSYLVNLARTWIYHQGYLVNSAAVERLLKPWTVVPTVVCAASKPCSM